ncbi:substrate-binding domain-containing protein [Klebsiella quasipneumoniae]|nr:substrate-binding domain-containing protein [Klebsiella quasipneumoniae]
MQKVSNVLLKGVDAIIVNPVDNGLMFQKSDQATAIICDSDLVNRRPQAELSRRLAYVGSDSILNYRLQMEALAKYLQNKGNVAILLGDLANESTRDRTKGVEEVKDVSIGVSMALFDDNFLTILRTSMQKEMKKDGVKSQIEDAKGDVSQQLQQVQNFIGQGVDAIIVNPVDTNAVKPIMDQATKAGIPLVFVNRRPQAELTDKMAYVGSDSILAGRLQMEALAKAMNGKGNVAILLGDLANESTRDRTKGVEEVVAKYPNIKIVQKQTAKFTRNDAVDVVSNWMTSGEDIQAIASNNDEMAIGALQALGKNPNHILIAGVDGTPDALQMLKSGKMIATIFQDAKGQGEGAVDAAIKLANGEKVEKIIDVPYQLITKENMAEFTNRNQK